LIFHASDLAQYESALTGSPNPDDGDHHQELDQSKPGRVRRGGLRDAKAGSFEVLCAGKLRGRIDPVRAPRKSIMSVIPRDKHAMFGK
jgi:hypothetical protein